MTPAVVSIIIPVFNQLSMTERCLATLAASTAVPHEIVVVDNASSDGTPAFLAALERSHATLRDAEVARPAGHASPWMRTLPVAFTVLRNTENRGFVDACNQAAAAATGRYLCFLNNDTEPLPRWLEELVLVLEADESVGAVGAKLLWPNGKIQEAGGIVFRDAMPFRYCGGSDRFDPAGNFRREVDYCSGAALLVPRDLFFKAGGFDARFAPAYFEDTDLCFTLRRMGYKVVYQPHAEVVHHEAATAGKDPTKGYRAFLVSNREKFRAKWRGVLDTDHWPREARLPARVANRAPGRRILWVDPHLPMPDRAAGSRRLRTLLAMLVEAGHQVTFVPSHMWVDDATRHYLKELQSLGVETYALDPASGWPPPGAALQPMNVAARAIEVGMFDLAICSFHYVALPLIQVARRLVPGLPVIADSVDVHFLRERREAEVAGDEALRQAAEDTRQVELEAYRAADAVLVVTDEDGGHLREHLPGQRIRTIPNVYDPVDQVPGFESRRDLLFVGYFRHRPNVDAVRWLHAEIFPRLRELVPGIRVHVVGSAPPGEVTAFNSADFLVHGYVKDLAPLLRSARVSIVPLRFGAGQKGKVVEALAWGLPCVTTPVGAEGMDLVDGEDALLAGDARAFAQQVARLHADPALWRRLSSRGREVVRSRYSRQAVRGALDRLVAEFAGS